MMDDMMWELYWKQDELQNYIDMTKDIEATIDNNLNNIDILDDEISNLQYEIDSKEGELYDIEIDNEKLTKDIELYKQEINTLEEDIEGLMDQLDGPGVIYFKQAEFDEQDGMQETLF